MSVRIPEPDGDLVKEALSIEKYGIIVEVALKQSKVKLRPASFSENDRICELYVTCVLPLKSYSLEKLVDTTRPRPRDGDNHGMVQNFSNMPENPERTVAISKPQKE